MKTEANHPINQISHEGFPSNLDAVMKDEYPLAIGLTKREYFAAMAMQGLLANSAIELDPDAVMEDSVRAADKLIQYLNK